MLWVVALPSPVSAGPAPVAYSANINYYLDGSVAAAGPSDYVEALSRPLASVTGCMLSTPTARACGSSSATIGLLTTQSTMTDTAPGSMAGSAESANGYATFRDIVVVRGLTPGSYQLVPRVTIEGTTDWSGVVLPFTASVGVQLYGPDGKAVIQDTPLDTTQHSVAVTRTLGGIPFTAGVPFNVMIGFGHAARLFRNLPANTSVTASYTMRVTGLAVLDALGRVVTSYDIGALSGAAYSASGIERVDVESPDFEFTVSGPEQTMIPNGNPWGLTHTPDEGMSYRTFDGGCACGSSAVSARS
ncbi:hypothetical protein LuPra_05392 [Luteitalea pratensis]|uniref:Uncharacterized protein n=2 Tax=Luteitalea pratensis TaxID=1855912 RepID=A0A143PVN4_LUTPR|nr:hypothetical protein LuPra_05392 [Luteitalea pratensis]